MRFLRVVAGYRMMDRKSSDVVEATRRCNNKNLPTEMTSRFGKNGW